MKIDNLAESQDFAQNITPNLIKNLTFTVLITHLVKQHAQVGVVDETKFFDQSMTLTNQAEEALFPSPLAGMQPGSWLSSPEEERKTEEEEISFSTKILEVVQIDVPKLRIQQGPFRWLQS